jgi:4Fe-4S iron-sulfur cluster binding domain/DR2241 stabilising domain
MIHDQLQRILTAGPLNIGEIQVRRSSDTSFALRHWQDADPHKPGSLRIYSDPRVARDLARFDVQNRYRPLKGAPTLPTGWELRLDSVGAVRLALDFFYPGALASWLAWREKRINPTDLRSTLSRQTGMYRVTAKLTNAEANQLAGSFCRSDRACLRTILWTLDGNRPDEILPPTKFDPKYDQLGQERSAIPFLCTEACNLFVAEARKIVKQRKS